MKDVIIMLENLDCAHCGSKIEALINKLDYVDNANLNFVNKKISIEYNNKEENEVFEDVKKIVHRLEPDVKVYMKLKNKKVEQIKHDDEKHENHVHNHQSHDNDKHCGCGCEGGSQCEHHEHTGEDHCDCGCNEHSCTHEHDGHSHNEGHEHKHAKHGGCSCGCEDEIVLDDIEEDNHNIDKFELIKIVSATVLFLLSIVLESKETLSMIFALVSYAIVGYEVVIKAFKNLFGGQIFDENFLMTVASLGAIFIGDYPEAAGVMLFYNVGEYFQSIAVNKSRNQIKSLLNIKPEFANLKTSDGLQKVNPDQININDIIVIKPGEKIPLDGIIIEGASTVDTSALTGESMPVDKVVNDEVLSGSINQNGVLTVKVTSSFENSTVSKILYMVEKASNKKSETENFITKFARYYTPAVVFIAALIVAIPTLALGLPFQTWLYKGLTFLVVSCPCALVLSIPLTYFSGLGCASKQGILIKGGNYLEALANAEIAVFDKTGTLTNGSFKVTEVDAKNGMSNDDLVELAAYGENYSNHPIALSIKNAFEGNINEDIIANYEEIAGHGIKVNINNEKVLLGNDKLMVSENVSYDIVTDKPGTILHVAKNNVYCGFIVISDTLKNDTPDLVKKLKHVGIQKTVMLTGDNRINANFVKNKIGLDEVYSELLPGDKVEKVEKLINEKSKNGKLLFVGDGINDAPVLTIADVGIAMGGIGSDAAIESADVVIMNDEPSKVAQSIKIAKKTRQIVMQNIWLCLGIKFLVMILTILFSIPMPLAVFADVGLAIIAVINASRILRMK